MPEVRVDPLSGHRTLVADEGPPWPGDGPVAGSEPFRLLPSAHPVLTPDAPTPAAEANRDLFWAGPAAGITEVIPHTSSGVSSVAELTPEEVQAAHVAWQERMRAHEDASYLHLVLDEGGEIRRSQAQLYALPFVPAGVARERERFGAYATRTMGGNLLADLVQEEVRRRQRIVAIDEETVLFAPYASAVPFQLLIAPRTPRRRFEDQGPTGARMLLQAIARLHRRLGAELPLTLWVRTAPQGAEYFSWRIDILPRLISEGGLALGTGLALNVVAPERAAAELREA